MKANERLLRRASVLVLIGLVVEAVTLFWSHPTAFLLFIGLGGLFIVPGIAIYLYWLVARRGEASDAA